MAYGSLTERVMLAVTGTEKLISGRAKLPNSPSYAIVRVANLEDKDGTRQIVVSAI
jgi:hypothetical protein